jgi:eukaryotic-like serine/threonine-protein kinase
MNGFHRDIKPDNILMFEGTGGFIFKLGDFGLAQDNNTSSVFTQGAAGTLGYIAPEIIAGSPFTSQADIYSLGVTALELLTGKLRSPSLPREQYRLAFLIRGMTSTDPKARPAITKIIDYASRTETSLLNPDNTKTP